jgi:hypothetical protein
MSLDFARDSEPAELPNHEMIASDADCKVETKFNDLKKRTDGLRTSTLCDKSELKWPVRFFKFNFTRKSFRLLAFLKIKNILWLLSRGETLRK